MGKLVVAWSPIVGQGGSSTVTSSLASLIALETSNKVLFTHSRKSKTVLDRLYKTADTNLTKNGMEGLERLIKSGLISKEAIRDYADTIYKNKLYYLQSGYNVDETEIQNARQLFSVLQAALDAFDIVFVNACNDISSIATKSLLSQAHSVIVTLPQNQFVIEAFFNGELMPEELKNKENIIVVITNYDDKANLSLRNIKRKSKLKLSVHAYPYVTELKNAINSEGLSDFYFRSLSAKKGSDVFNLMNSIRSINMDLLNQLDLESSELIAAGENSL